MSSIRQEFNVHILNEDGIDKARRIGSVFTLTLEGIEEICGADGREMAIVRTKLQEAAFFAKRAMALRAENQRDRES
ncbi:MAG TPA: hypothetical protein VIY27_09060 [Myxococcota bacterium]